MTLVSFDNSYAQFALRIKLQCVCCRSNQYQLSSIFFKLGPIFRAMFTCRKILRRLFLNSTFDQRQASRAPNMTGLLPSHNGLQESQEQSLAKVRWTSPARSTQQRRPSTWCCLETSGNTHLGNFSHVGGELL